jgi:lipid-binding SYLF domain-containing protein
MEENFMKKIISISIAVLAFLLITNLPSEAGWKPGGGATAEGQKVKNPKVAEALANFKNHGPGLKKYFDKAYGYAIFPSVGKGGIGIGGAYGKGELHRKGKLIGTTKLTQLTIGFQLGGQKYSEIIFFKNRRAFNDFKEGNFELGAQASAVAVTAGASLNAGYDHGVAIFTIVKGGLMYEATVGGQKFSFKPAK